MLMGILTEPLMSLMGAVRRLPGYMAAVFGVSVALTFAAAPYGVLPLAWSQFVLAILVLGATIWLFTRYAGIRWAPVLNALRGAVLPVACGTASIAALDLAAAGHGVPDLVAAAAFGLIGAAVQFGAILVFDRSFGMELLEIFRPTPPPKGATS